VTIKTLEERAKMPDPKAQVAEAPEIKATEIDETAVDTATDVETTEPIAEEAEPSDAAAEPSPQQKIDEAVAQVDKEAEGEVDAVDEFLPSEDKKKDNVQRRIDQLTAQLKEAKSEVAKLRDNKPVDKAPEYSDAQLKAALKKAFDEGDHELAWEIIDYRNKKTEKNLIDMYENVQKENAQKQQAVVGEWNKVCNDYSKAWQDDSGSELYPGASKELSLGSESSLLYRLAMKFYRETVDDDGRPIYQVSGGQRMAVADAMAAILKKRKLSGQDNEKKRLERSLAKAKRKTATPSSASIDADAPRRPRGESDKLADYMSERRKFLNERI
jgi:hypothetical protein